MKRFSPVEPMIKSGWKVRSRQLRSFIQLTHFAASDVRGVTFIERERDMASFWRSDLFVRALDMAQL